MKEQRAKRSLSFLVSSVYFSILTHSYTLSPVLFSPPQSNAAACRDRAEVDAARGAAEGQVGRLSQEAERLRRRVQELENEVAKLNRIIDEAKLQENRLAERLSRVEVKQHTQTPHTHTHTHTHTHLREEPFSTLV